jgi:hypothetical protein
MGYHLEGETQKPKGADNHDTAKHLLIKDRSDEGESNGPWRIGLDGRIQT